MKTVVRSTLAAVGLISVLVSAAAAFDFPQSHSAGAGGVTILSHASPSDMIALPGTVAEHFAVGFESGYLRQYDLKDLDRLYVAAAGTYRRFFGGIGLAQFGISDLYAEKTVKATAGYRLGEFTAGGSISAMRVEFGGNYGSASLITFGLGAGYTNGRFRAHVSGDNLTNPKMFDVSEPVRRRGSAIAEWSTAKRLATVIAATKVEKESVKYSIGQRIPLARGSALYWGVSTRPVEYGGGVDIATKIFTLTYGAKIHPVLGLTHSVSISICKARSSETTSNVTGDRDE